MLIKIQCEDIPFKRWSQYDDIIMVSKESYNNEDWNYGC